jgi:aspartate carbamoyltransferase catalytic subunit
VSRSLLAIRGQSREALEEIISLGQRIRWSVDRGKAPFSPAPSKTIGLLFFENSTRTRVAFEQAASLLGHKVVSFASGGSSISKGESLKDTILTLKFARLEAMVIRHMASGAPSLAARHFEGPVVNAGDGQHEHPTQALGDAMTLLERKGKISGLKVAIVGDVLHSRVARSNIWMLHALGAKVRLVGPRALMPANTSSFPAEVFYDLRAGIAGCDAIICLRLQRERMTDGILGSIGEYAASYQVNRSTLKAASPDAIVMHPGPMNRGVEIDDHAADGPQSAILSQVANGIFAKTAALAWSLGEEGRAAS